MGQTGCAQLLALFLLAGCGPAPPPGTDESTTEPAPPTGSSTAQASESTTGPDTTGPSTTEAGKSTTTTTGGSETTAMDVDPYVACRSLDAKIGCSHGSELGLPFPQSCVRVDVYLHPSDACTDRFEPRCEVLERSTTGGTHACSISTYSYVEGWFRELDDGTREFWGVYSNPSPPVDTGFTRCLEQPEMGSVRRAVQLFQTA